MKRSAPPKRKTPLKRSTRPLARSRIRRKLGPPGFTEETKAHVRRRSGNRCEARSSRCTGKASHFHHRKLRRFKDHRDVNALHVCAQCHDYMHANRIMAKLMGWICDSSRDPADVPVRLGSG